MDNKLNEYVNVSLRIRPVINQDSSTSSCIHVISKQPPVLLVLDRPQSYHFDNIFTEEVDQEMVYDETVKPLVEYVKQGYSCTVFAYGQTGTGKTYTMGTSTQVVTEKDVGLIPRALRNFFEICDSDTEISISISFIEIYNEKVFDLLQNDNNPPLIVKGFKVQGFSQEKVYSYQDATLFLEKGNRNRHTAGTKLNLNSSRSHAIFTIYYNVKYKDHETTAKLNLVDLAGCESVRKTGNQGSTFHEGVNINKGLLCIGQVMTALSTNSNYIPYRQSIITTILQDSLNKKNFVSLIACINSIPEDCNETIQTLEFAHRVKKMKNKPEVNELLMNYKKENPTLFQCNKISNTPFKRPAAPYQTPCPPKRVKNFPLRTKEQSTILENITSVDSPKSLLSMSMSSMSSHVDITQQTLSPVIKKYMSAMESSLLNRLETVIKNTLKRPTRSSLLMKEPREENKENTPSMSWNKIQNEVSKIVKNEIAQLTSKATRAASSPIEDHHDFDKIKRVLNYEKLEDAEHCVTNNDALVVKSNFKVPELPVTRKKYPRTKRTPSISPIEYIPTRIRRSERLSMKKIINNNTLDDSDISFESTYIQKKKLKRGERYFFEGRNPNGSDKDNESQYGRSPLKSDGKSIDLKDSSLKSSRIYLECFGQISKELKDSDTRPKDSIDSQYDKRRSVRLAKKIIDSQDSKSRNNEINLTSIKPETINDSKLLDESFILSMPSCTEINDVNRIPLKERDYESRPDGNKHNVKSKKSKNHAYGIRRHSLRLMHKDKNLETNLVSAGPLIKNCRKKSTLVKRKTILTVKDTPIGKRLLKNNPVKDSPATSHTKHVLDVLNNGNLKQLEKLHSIGPKTAQQVQLFREINGPLEKISDLSQIPGWHGKRFKKFSEQNFLKEELV